MFFPRRRLSTDVLGIGAHQIRFQFWVRFVNVALLCPDDKKADRIYCFTAKIMINARVNTMKTGADDIILLLTLPKRIHVCMNICMRVWFARPVCALMAYVFIISWHRKNGSRTHARTRKHELPTIYGRHIFIVWRWCERMTDDRFAYHFAFIFDGIAGCISLKFQPDQLQQPISIRRFAHTITMYEAGQNVRSHLIVSNNIITIGNRSYFVPAQRMCTYVARYAAGCATVLCTMADATIENKIFRIFEAFVLFAMAFGCRDRRIAEHSSVI